MDHRNGGDPLVPPRPPKLLPTVHRTRAAAIDTDRIIMNESIPQVKNKNNSNSSSSSSSTNSNSTISTLPLSASSTLCSGLLKPTTTINNVKNSHSTFSIIASSTITTPPPPPPPHKSSSLATAPPPPPPYKPSTLIATKTTTKTSSIQDENHQQQPPPTLPKSTSTLHTAQLQRYNNNNNSNNNNNELVNKNSNNNNISVIYPSVASDYDRFQILHLTYLPELPHHHHQQQQQLNNFRQQTNTVNGNATTTNSFSRRRALPPLPQPQPQPPIISTNFNNNSTLLFGSTSGVGILSPMSTPTIATTINGSINNHNNNNNNNNGVGNNSVGVANFLNHFHSFEPHSLQSVSSSPTSITIAATTAATSVSPAVTLTNPRPESERLNNEYVETPLRQQQQQQQQQQQFLNSTTHVLQLQHSGVIDNHNFNDDGQSSTHHLLMLPQRRNVLLQQQQQHHQYIGGINNISEGISTSEIPSTLIISPNLATTTTPLSSPSRSDTNIELLHSHNTFKSDTDTTTATTIKKLGKTIIGEQKNSIASTTGNTITKQPRSLNHIMVDTIDAASGSSNNDNNVAIVMVANNNNNNNNNNNSGCNNFLTRNSSNRSSNATINNIKNNGKDRQALEDLLTPHSNHNNNNNTNSHNNHQHNGHERLGNDTLNSLTCPNCNKCRCEQCMSPRPLPQSWVCKQKCFCSADTTLDTCTCLCCAKAIFYHCAADTDGMDYDDSGAPCVDDPCSCSPYKRTQRWGWLCALSLVMPCLWCYWPLRGCTKLCETLYGHFGKRGCRCRQTVPSSASAMLPNLRLGLITTNVATLSNNNSNINGNGVSVLHDNSNSIVGCTGNEMVSIGNGGGKFPCINKNRNLSSTSSSSSCKDASSCNAELTSEKHLLDTSLDY